MDGDRTPCSVSPGKSGKVGVLVSDGDLAAWMPQLFVTADLSKAPVIKDDDGETHFFLNGHSKFRKSELKTAVTGENCRWDLRLKGHGSDGRWKGKPQRTESYGMDEPAGAFNRKLAECHIGSSGHIGKETRLIGKTASKSLNKGDDIGGTRTNTCGCGELFPAA